MNTFLSCLILIVLLAPKILKAEVISSSQNGFQIVIERTIDTDHKTAYQQFINIGEWWSADHTWFGKAENLTIDPRAGGCFCERDSNKEVLHMTVSFVDPNNEIKLIGGLGPLQMMGIQGGMSWKFVKIDDTKTKIIHHYQVSGYVEGGLEELSKIVDFVQTLQVDRLVTKLKTSSKSK